MTASRPLPPRIPTSASNSSAPLRSRRVWIPWACSGDRTYYNAWRFSSSSGDADYFSPQDDAENILGARSRYERLGTSLPKNKIDPFRTQADNMTTLLSAGPFATLEAG